MTEGQDESGQYWTPASEQPPATLNWWRGIIVTANLLFTAWFTIILLQVVLEVWIYVIPFVLIPLVFWASYHSKSNDFRKSKKAGVNPEFNIALDFVALVLNPIIVILIFLMWSEFSSDISLSAFWFVGVYMVALTNYENLASTVAYIRVTKE